MQYKIKVEIIGSPDERGYTRDKEIYSQLVEDINLLAVIEAVNKSGSQRPQTPFKPFETVMDTHSQ